MERANRYRVSFWGWVAHSKWPRVCDSYGVQSISFWSGDSQLGDGEPCECQRSGYTITWSDSFDKQYGDTNSEYSA